MSTLLLRLSGPMQSWGTQSRFRDRDTGLEPSKSGVIGLICSALGRSRDEPVDDLAALRMGVRVDREGTMKMDWQTAGGNFPRWGKGGKVIGTTEAVISPRYYLSDAVFLAGLEGPREMLLKLQEALRRPRWQLFLGRKAFPPGEPVYLPDGLRDTSLEKALLSYPVQGGAAQGRRLRVVIETGMDESNEVRTDVPLSFAARRFATRNVRTDWREVE